MAKLADLFQYIAEALPGGSLNPEWTPGRVEALKDAALGMVPVYGSAREVPGDVEAGNYGSAALNTGLAGLDMATLGAAKPLIGLAGILTRGGLRDLTAIHKLESGILEQILRAGYLQSPSTAVTLGGDLGHKFGRATAVLNAKAIDPATSGMHLFNRDIYAKRAFEDIGPGEVKRALLRQKAVKEARAIEKRGLGARLTEGIDIHSPSAHSAKSVTSGGEMHALSIEQSPQFTSFRHYENDPAGAALLTTDDAAIMAARNDLHRGYNSLTDILDTDIASPALIKELAGGKSDDATQKLARSLLMQAKYLPTKYAEGKIFGQLPFNKDTVAGVVVPKISRELDTLSSRAGIPVTTYSDALMSPGELEGNYKTLEKLREFTRTHNLSAGDLSQTLAEAFPGLKLSPYILMHEGYVPPNAFIPEEDKVNLIRSISEAGYK